MKPTEKAKPIANLLEKTFGRTTAIESGRCIPPPVGCGLTIDGFRDPISEKEYRISGLCQSCQDKVFGGGE